MKVALIADIHGNLTALDAALAEIDRESPDELICLGDVAIFGPQPNETLDRMYTRFCPMVMGNTDAWALRPRPRPVGDEESRYVNDIELWGAKKLDFAYPEYIRNFRRAISAEMGNGLRMLCYHGSPASYHDAIDETTPDDVLDGYFADYPHRVLAGGHTHVQFLRPYGDRYLLNPGSIGLPFAPKPDGSGDYNPAWAEYAMITWDGTDLDIDLRRVPYDLDALRAAVHASDMPHADWWLKDWGRGEADAQRLGD